MVNNVKLNNLVQQYQMSKQAETFREIYLLISNEWKSWVRRDVRRTLSDAHRVLEIYHEALLKAIEIYNKEKGNFIKLLQRCVTYLRSREQRDNLVRMRREEISLTVRTSDEDAPTSEVASEYNLEDHIHKKKEADQRQLIDFLLDRANDPVTTLIVTKFREDEFGKMSITALAKALGLHHEVVKRKLRALSRHYDANRFGDIADYLAV
ncbi:hypothetical protein [Paenibacillus naphthalenovorans]|uniref:hypothetical protein n=1 Tax=Paenibacillus naphthalenovorans TaxID=162209 RepID=UPI003D2AE9DA